MILYILIGMLVSVLIAYGILLIVKEVKNIMDLEKEPELPEDEIETIQELDIEIDEMLNTFNEENKGK